MFIFKKKTIIIITTINRHSLYKMTLQKSLFLRKRTARETWKLKKTSNLDIFVQKPLNLPLFTLSLRLFLYFAMRLLKVPKSLD